MFGKRVFDMAVKYCWGFSTLHLFMLFLAHRGASDVVLVVVCIWFSIRHLFSQQSGLPARQTLPERNRRLLGALHPRIDVTVPGT
jgi:hypothetical protein